MAKTLFGVALPNTEMFDSELTLGPDPFWQLGEYHMSNTYYVDSTSPKFPPNVTIDNELITLMCYDDNKIDTKMYTSRLGEKQEFMKYLVKEGLASFPEKSVDILLSDYLQRLATHNRPEERHVIIWACRDLRYKTERISLPIETNLLSLAAFSTKTKGIEYILQDCDVIPSYDKDVFNQLLNSCFPQASICFDSNASVCVAYDNSKGKELVSIMTVVPVLDYTSFKGFIIWNVCTNKAYRRQGMFKNLFDNSLYEILRSIVNRIKISTKTPIFSFLTPDPANYTSLHDMYEKMGYRDMYGFMGEDKEFKTFYDTVLRPQTQAGTRWMINDHSFYQTHFTRITETGI